MTGLLLIGIFVSGLSASAAAALWVPKKKVDWPVSDKPIVKVTINTGRK